MRDGSEAATRGRSGRVRRRLFNLAAAVSLVLCVAASVLWVRSYSVYDIAGWTSRGATKSRTISAISFRGSMLLYCRGPLRAQSQPSVSAWSWDRLDPRGVPAPSRHYFPVSFSSAQTAAAPIHWSLRVSHWLVVGAAAATPLVWLVKRSHQRCPRGPGLCPNCGYDLRASPGRCPECGTEAKPQATEGATA
jgi:hypothetical protein